MVPLIVALDTELARAVETARALGGVVAGFKVGWDLVLESGVSVVSEISNFGRVLVDLKIADIPTISGRVVEKLIKNGACCVIVHGFLYPSTPRGPHIYILAKMTVGTMYDEVWEILLERLDDVRGVVLPGNQPDVIARARRKLGCRYRIISPGIGTQGGSPGDAIRAGADFEIVGRYILEDFTRVEEWSVHKPSCFTEF